MTLVILRWKINMKIIYHDKKTQKLSTDISYAKKVLPAPVAQKLVQLINFIEAAESLQDIKARPALRFHKLKARAGQFAITINGQKSSYRLILEFNDRDFNRIFKQASSITVIQIVEVSKHYGEKK